MTRIQNVKVGDPMGFKVNISTEVVLNSLVEALKVYHGGKYIIGKDTAFKVTPHYHIHWFSVKEVTANALKVFRSTLKNKFNWLQKSDKLYTGQETESADPNKWIAYCIKETLVETNGIEVTEDIKVLAKASFETKRQNKVYSEKKQIEEKEKKEFKQKICAYVKDNLETYEIPDKYKNVIPQSEKIRLLIIKYFKENSKEGSIKKSILDNYVMYCNIHIHEWDEFQIYKNVYMV